MFRSLIHLYNQWQQKWLTIKLQKWGSNAILDFFPLLLFATVISIFFFLVIGNGNGKADKQKAEFIYSKEIDALLSRYSVESLRYANIGKKLINKGGLNLYPLDGLITQEEDLGPLKHVLEWSQGQRIGAMQKDDYTFVPEPPSIWPIRGNVGHITNSYGKSVDPFTRRPYFHRGVDISNDQQGDPVIATADGIVIAAGFDKRYGYKVLLKHTEGFQTLYAHMKSIIVQKGQLVFQGTQIGSVGNTGLSTGAHLHYEVSLNQQLLNPKRYMLRTKASS
ncbi:MAG: M23 family metallopeptidase [Sphingobacteriia bacterium]|nr:M23 family metallopeptidase [Sphingobacteriia bacterium]